jgi:hypothetical protein
MPTSTPPNSDTVDLALHPSVVAWTRLNVRAVVPALVTPLKTSPKSDVYRMHGAGPGGSNVIAKRCRTLTSLNERCVYERVLPRLSIPSLAYHGHVDEDDGIDSWLFMEDAGDEQCSAEARVEFMEWLGHLHTCAAAILPETGLGEAGASRYVKHLRSGRSRVAASLPLPHFTEEERELLQRILSISDHIERRWDELRPLYEGVPQTLVHGDLCSKNIRVRRTPSGAHMLPLDWETAGKGVPAADLMMVSESDDATGKRCLEAYWSVVGPAWGMERKDVQMLAHVGMVFRVAASIDWASERLRFPSSQRAVRDFRSFERHAHRVFDKLGW